LTFSGDCPIDLLVTAASESPFDFEDAGGSPEDGFGADSFLQTAALMNGSKEN